jgi:hypothetical protein
MKLLTWLSFLKLLLRRLARKRLHEIEITSVKAISVVVIISIISVLITVVPIGNKNDIDSHEHVSESDLDGIYVGSIEKPALTHLQRNASPTRDFTRTIPNPIVVAVKINGYAARALLDTGSHGDFVSTSLVDQLKLKTLTLEKPIPLHMSVQGSCSKINYITEAEFQYQNIKELRSFDVANLANYDLILGTPFLFQHQVMLGLNGSRVVIGSDKSVPIQGQNVSKLFSRSMDLVDEDLDGVRTHLKEYADKAGLFEDPSKSPLPPFWDINHTIPLIDENLVIPWRPSGFLGSVGYLADDITGVRVPMGILHGICGANTHFRWTETHQRAFEQIKEYTAKFREHHRVPLNYKKDSPPINVVTDASSTGIAGVASQGDDWKTA